MSIPAPWTTRSKPGGAAAPTRSAMGLPRCGVPMVTYTDQRHQGDSDYSKSALKVRNLLGRGQHPRRPQHPGSEAEQTDSNDEENCFAGDTDTPGSGWLSFSRQEKEAKARKSNYAAS